MKFDVQLLHQGQQRYAHYYFQQLQLANQFYENNQSQQGLNKLVIDWGQIQQAQKWVATNTTTSNDIAEICLAYLNVCVELLEIHQTISEQRKWYEDALQAARQLGRVEDEARCLHYIGIAGTD